MRDINRSIVIVCCYCRTSGKINGEESIPNQKFILKEYSNQEGYNIRGYIVDEAKSAFSNQRREGYEELMRLIDNKKVDCVLVTFFNRLARRAEDLLNILLLMKSKDIECISVSQNKRLSTMSHYEIAFEAIMTEEEDKSITRRIHSSKDRSRKQGEYLTNPAIGYARDEKRHLNIVEADAKIVRDIFNRFLEGQTTKLIAKQLNELGIAGRKWSTHNVEGLLTNPIYSGKLYKREVGEDLTVSFELLSSVEHDAIIDEQTFFKVVEVINEGKRKRGKRTYSKQGHLFKGVLCCPVCNNKMQANTDYYRCTNKKCSFKSVRKDRIEGLLLEYIKEIDKKPDSFKFARQKVHKHTMKINSLKSEMAMLKQKFSIGKINVNTLKEHMFRITLEIKALQDKVDYGVYQEEDVTFSELIEERRFEGLNDLMIRRKLTLTLEKEGNSYRIKKL
ncbi:recombinase family protein [Peribacillus sp. NPDC097198]|uniref:recombinase family protein n=1 Tax=Peribacillus sp. NPDC097198 TaxID=3364397 RepID=UPI00381E492E